MADIDKRLHYFNGQFLQDVDFNAEQAYHLERQRRHNRVMHTFGIAEGLTVTAPQGVNSITVSPGTALDGLGQQIVLTQGDTRTLQLNQQAFLGKTVLVVISYAEATSDPATVGGSGTTRWQERPNVQLVIDDANAPPPDTSLRLARLTLNSSGATTGNADLTVRVSAGVKLGTDVPVQTLRLSNPNLASGLWPVFTAGAANRADLTGNLTVSGTATVAGATTLATGVTVTGGAANLQGGAVVTGNGIVSGNLSVGGSANLNAGANIFGAANLNNGAAITGNASVTGNATIGGTATVTGLLNGRNVSADGSKLDTHVAIVAGNPHGTLASQLSDYDYGKRNSVSANFTQSDADGATRTLPVGFQPRFLWFTAGFNVYLAAGYYLSSPISGFADFRSGINQNGLYLTTIRIATAPYQALFTQPTTGNLGTQYFVDYTTTPNQNISYTLTITSVTSTGLVLTLNRSTYAGYTAPSFYASIVLVCVG